MTKSKLNFTKPSGESRLTSDSKTEISKGEIQRFNLDLPKELAIELKIMSARDGIPMREIVVAALTAYMNK